MNHKLDVFVINIFVLPVVRLIAYLGHKNIQPWTPSSSSKSLITFYLFNSLLTVTTEQLLFIAQNRAKASEPVI